MLSTLSDISSMTFRCEAGNRKWQRMDEHMMLLEREVGREGERERERGRGRKTEGENRDGGRGFLISSIKQD